MIDMHLARGRQLRFHFALSVTLYSKYLPCTPSNLFQFLPTLYHPHKCLDEQFAIRNSQFFLGALVPKGVEGATWRQQGIVSSTNSTFTFLICTHMFEVHEYGS